MMNTSNTHIVNRNNNYADLLFYKKAVVIYDLTYIFCERFIDKHDRTFDQMVQAARSSKQNIVEGYVDLATSVEMSLKLLNIARGSMLELLQDYEDYLRTRNLRLWPSDSEESLSMQRLGRTNLDPQYYAKLATTRSDETIANMVLVLLHQAEYLLYKYIDHCSEKFLREGGFREKLSTERRKVRGF